MQNVNGNLVVVVAGVGLTIVGGILASKFGDAFILAAEKGNFKADTKDIKDIAVRTMDITEYLLSFLKSGQKAIDEADEVIDVSKYQEA